MRNGLWQFLSHQHLGRGASRNLQRCKILQQKMRKEGIMVVCMWVYQPTSPLWLLVKPSPHIKTSCYRRTHNAGIYKYNLSSQTEEKLAHVRVKDAILYLCKILHTH
ncbi:overexpressed in colon carcinoma 1 protein isoform X2 [Betta splendens]|uniref:Overexpressed in colon carcinoma 1 protein isoform X2 n=1 Tax=Betta splendens TaxID=158456 RepID=A0A9W2XVD2_BETSP|nr:overexpressed in colon carcinoma 1 protein isoform X2 [Betta splendens]